MNRNGGRGDMPQGGAQRGNGAGGGMMDAMLSQKPKNLKKTLVRLFCYMKGSSLFIVGALLFAVGGAVMQVVSPKILGNATTLLYESLRNKAAIDFTALFRILLTVTMLYVGYSVASYLQSFIMTNVSQKLSRTLRGELKAKMNRVPVAYFDRNSDGNLMSIATNDMDNISTNLQTSLVQALSILVQIAGTLVFMLTISPVLTGLAAVLIPASVLLMSFLMPKTQGYYKKYLNQQGELNGQIEETFRGHSVVRGFGLREKEQDKFDQINNAMYESGWKSKLYGGLMRPAIMILQNLDYILLTVVGAMRVASGRILIGDFQAFLQYSTQFSGPVAMLGMVFNSVLSMAASAERVFEVLDAEETVAFQEKFKNTYHDSVKVEFRNVAFSYTEKPLISDFNLRVEPGQTIAIVGKTGAGKSTILSLLERFYEIKSGGIYLEGTDTRNLDARKLREKIGMVLQDTWLFSGSIYDNIHYGNETANQGDVFSAAESAYVDDFVKRLPDGYNTVLNEEAGNISNGQKQLITIARAFVKNPDILILDEATSNVDSRTEMLIQKAMNGLMKGRTSFVVAHRLSTIYGADQIIVIDDGQIVETGTHETLLAKNGVYADIFNSQFAGESV